MKLHRVEHPETPRTTDSLPSRQNVGEYEFDYSTYNEWEINTGKETMVHRCWLCLSKEFGFREVKLALSKQLFNILDLFISLLNNKQFLVKNDSKRV